MKYKFIFLILSSSNLSKDNAYYASNAKYEELKIINKKYYDLFPNDIKFFYLEMDPSLESNIVEKNEYIYVKGPETVIPGMLLKQQEAAKYINERYDYDYFLITNLSSLWNLPVLFSLYNNIPRNHFFGGNLQFNSFISGSGIIISRDLTSTFLNINRNINNYNDVVISEHFKNCRVPIFKLNDFSNYKMNYQIADETVTDLTSVNHVNNNKIPTVADDILYFRIRNSTFERDLYVTKILIKKLYNIEY